jgi:type I restriction enzyme M protein
MPAKRAHPTRKHVKSDSLRLEAFTALKETSTRKKVDLWLTNLGWNTDEESSNCNVTTERALTKEQKQKLKGKEPDYFLYKSGTKEIIGTIETKAKGENLDESLKDAIEKYASPLEVPIVFVTDGSFFRTWYQKNRQSLFLNGEPLNQLLSESVVLRFLAEGSSISSESPKVQYTRDQLIAVFKWTDDKLRKEGLRQGVERFTEFANILFLKLISEIEDFNENNGEPRRLAKKYCWESFCSLSKEQMKEYINGVVLPHLVDRYNHSGDVFQLRLGIKNATTLKAIVDKLSELTLINTDSDIKGDAFEYFLKDSITVGNDLGEYFTPRHIVRLMVDIADPQFGEKIYDPTCGTGGFLIEAFKHVKRLCKPTQENLHILKDETVFGNELTNTARIAKQNMILTGDGHTNIEQKDSLEHPVKGKYDVVLANPPYGQETDWGHLYDVPSEKNADCVFVQHIMKALNENGRAVAIVPEGFLFRTGVDKKVRELLLQRFKVEAVISLPAGVFNPYTASKVNIIVFHNGEGSTKQVWFYDMHNDGFDLGSTRKPIPQNDLPDLRAKWQEKPTSENSWWATYEQIKTEDYDLTAQPYNPHPIVGTPHERPEVLLKDLIETQTSLLKELEGIGTEESKR